MLKDNILLCRNCGFGLTTGATCGDLLENRLLFDEMLNIWVWLFTDLKSADIIANWSIDNGMRINTMKTKEIIISFCRDPVVLPYINIDGLP